MTKPQCGFPQNKTIRAFCMIITFCKLNSKVHNFVHYSIPLYSLLSNRKYSEPEVKEGLETVIFVIVRKSNKSLR